jgi:hypothetical protein
MKCCEGLGFGHFCVQSPCNPLIEDYTQIFYMIDKGDIPPIHCKMNLRGPKSMRYLNGSRVESYVTTDGQSPSLSWNKAPIWGLRPDFYYCQKFAGLLMWGAVSDERTGLSFTIATGPRQRSHSPV